MIWALYTLIYPKSKLKEILKDLSDNLNGFSNQFLCGEYFENKFSKLVTAKQKSKSLFIGWMLEKRIWVEDRVFVISETQIRGAPCHIVQKVGDNSR